ncbi:MAG: hypothetical protein WC479_08285 [Candidatus Izemoplasmatales bacterium]
MITRTLYVATRNREFGDAIAKNIPPARHLQAGGPPGTTQVYVIDMEYEGELRALAQQFKEKMPE